MCLFLLQDSSSTFYVTGLPTKKETLKMTVSLIYFKKSLEKLKYTVVNPTCSSLNEEYLYITFRPGSVEEEKMIFKQLK